MYKSPLSWGSKSPAVWSRVDFPEPDWPIRPIISPLLTCKLIPLKTCSIFSPCLKVLLNRFILSNSQNSVHGTGSEDAIYSQYTTHLGL